MFAPDIVTLKQFYATPFGRDISRFIGTRIHAMWPHAQGDVMLGIGYCTPYLEHYVNEAAPVCVCMPAQQGAAFWPPEQNLVFLGHESELPFRESSVNRVLLIHSFENTEQLSWMIEELWRVLTPGGRILVIVPNRMGFWCRSSHTPFGYGRPFSLAQLRDLLSEHQFTCTDSSSALFMPPVRLRFLWRIAHHLERVGRAVCPFIGGVLLLEAQKQIYASIKQPVTARSSYAAPARSTPALGLES
ncbi:MAG: class I SAM-dependent methyltransferase [Rickettsiales bacterium]|nr:class I SAM-dependent methyltransferase [Rickettsiales bacterium]